MGLCIGLATFADFFFLCKCLVCSFSWVLPLPSPCYLWRCVPPPKDCKTERLDRLRWSQLPEPLFPSAKLCGPGMFRTFLHHYDPQKPISTKRFGAETSQSEKRLRPGNVHSLFAGVDLVLKKADYWRKDLPLIDQLTTKHLSNT